MKIADGLTDQDREAWPSAMATITGFYPSLYINIAADYLKLASIDSAREFLRKAEDHRHVLPDTDYGTMIGSSIDWVRAELSACPH